MQILGVECVCKVEEFIFAGFAVTLYLLICTYCLLGK